MLAIIGGSGLDQMPGLQNLRQIAVTTPFGVPSAPLSLANWHEKPLVFLPRHGGAHSIPPHKINYRANIWALKEQGATQVIGVAAVGGIAPDMGPGTLIIPDQIIDYSHGREQSFFDGDFQPVDHIDCTEPYCESLRHQLFAAAKRAGVAVQKQACYGVTQGPRLETRAEIRRMQRDGVDIVGMTAMPEAALAREAGLCYANCALVVNWAAGLAHGPISMQDVHRELDEGMSRLLAVLERL